VVLIHHYFHSKEELFLATMQIPVPIHELVAPLVAECTDGLGERLLRTVLAMWESDLQASFVGSLRTAVAESATTRSMQEFLTLTVEVLGQALQGTPISRNRGKPAARARRVPTRRTDDGPLHPQAAGPG
jgi:hypothetical protein